MQENDTSRRRKFYDQMSEAYDLGSYEEFDSKMNNADSRRKLYDFIDKDGQFDIGDFDYFDKAMQPASPEKPVTQQPAAQPQPATGVQQPTDAAGNPITNNGQPYSKEVLDAFYSQDNQAPNFRDLSQIAADMQQSGTTKQQPAAASQQPATTTQPEQPTAPVPQAGVEVPYRPEPYIEQPFKEKNEEMQRLSQDPNLNPYWASRHAEEERRMTNPGTSSRGFAYTLEGMQEAQEAERARQMNRSAYDQQNFDKFYDSRVAPVFAEERQKGRQQTQEAVKGIPNYDIPGAQSGFARMFESSVAEAKYNDPEKIANATLKRVQEDNSAGGFGDYVLSRMGINGSSGNDEGDSPQLSDKEKEMLNLLFEQETKEVAQQITDRIYNQYKQENAPKSVLDYISGKAFNENLAASLYDAMVRRAADSSGIREQLRAMASEEFGKDQSWLTRMAGGAAPFAVDMLTGAFGIPNIVGRAVVKGGTKLAAKQVVKEMEKRAAAKGLEGEALKEATSGAAGVAERYLVNNAPILNIALRTASSAANFATYDVQGEIARQIAEGKFKPVDLMKAAVHGAVLGGATGAVGGAIGQATRNATRATKIGADVAGLGAESAVFGLSSGLAKAQAEGVDIQDVDWADTMGEAFGAVVGMKTVGGVMHPKEFLKRYQKSKDYDLQLNQHDIDELKAAGYDFDGLFKGLGKFGETAPMEGKTINKAAEYITDESGKRTQKNATTEEAWVDKEAYQAIMENPEISSSTKRKLAYIATGRVLKPEAVFGATMNVDENGKASITTLNAYGNPIETKDYKSESEAKEAYDELQKVSKANTLGGLERIAEESGHPEIIDEAKGRTKEETGIDVDDLDRLAELPEEQANKALDTYTKNLQESYIERFNADLERIGETAEAGNRGEMPPTPPIESTGGESGTEAVTTGTGESGSVPETAETGTSGATLQRTERREAAYNRGASVAENQGDLTVIGQDARLAEARLRQQLPDDDRRLSVIRDVVMQNVMQGNDEAADQLIDDAVSRNALNPQQIEAIDQWRDAIETQRGIEDAVITQTDQYEQQQRAELEAISDPQGNVTQLQLRDGRTVYYKSGDLTNHYGGIFAVDENGETIQVPVRDIAEKSPSVSMENMLASEVEDYASSLTDYYRGIADGTQLMEGQQVDMIVSGQPLTAVVAGTDQQGNILLQLEDGSMMPMTPDDTHNAIVAAENVKIQQQLQAEAESARLAEQQQRFGSDIAGFTEGQPDLSSVNTKPKTAAEYIKSQLGADGTDPEKARKQYVTNIQNSKEQLSRLHEETQNKLDRLNQWLAGNEDIADPQEVEQTRQQIASLDAAIKDIVARQQNWGEIRRQLMTQEELNAMEQQRRRDIFKARSGYQPQLPQRNLTTDENRITLENGQPNFGLTSVGNANNYLLRNFEDSTDAERFINDQRLALRNRQRDEVQPEINRRNELLNAYATGHQELNPDEVKQLAQEVADYEAMQDALSDEAVRLREIAEGIPALYERNGREQQLTPAEQRGKALDKASSREDKLRIAREVYKDYPEALDAINNQEPRDVEEYIAQNLPIGKMNWEGWTDSTGRQHIGVQGAVFGGRGATRGIGKDYATNAFNMYLAPTGEGMSFDEMVHYLYEDGPESGDMKIYDDTLIRDTLADMLRGAKTPSDISHRVIDSRIAEAEALVEQQEEYEREMEEQAKLEEMEQWAEAYHLTPEERADFEEFMRMPPMEPEREMINQLIAEYEEQNTASERVDSQHPSGETGGNGESGQVEVQGQGAAGEAGGNPQQQGVEGAENGTGVSSVSNTDVAGGTSGVTVGSEQGKQQFQAEKQVVSGRETNGSEQGNNQENPFETIDKLRDEIIKRQQMGEYLSLEPSWSEKDLENRNLSELRQLKSKAQKDLSTNKVILGTTNIAKGSKKEKIVTKNIAQAEVNIKALDDAIAKRMEKEKSLIDAMEAGGAMVDHLKDMGVDVTDNIAEMRKAKKQAEKDNSQEGKMRKMATNEGNVYGFAYKGRLYLDPRKVNANLPLHEYGHLWCEAFRRLNPEGWKDVVGVMKQDAGTWKFIKDLYPELTSEDDIAEEMIARGSGDNGEERIRQEFERMSQRDPSYKGKWNNIWKNISKAIQDFWKKMGDFLHIAYESPKQVYDQVLKDFAEGVNPRKRVEEWLRQRDDEYLNAVEDGNMAKATELFNEALKENIGNGMTPFVAVDRYRNLRSMAHKVKNGKAADINKAAKLMAPLIPENAVLIPAPSHTGKATDMLKLAKAIARQTGSEVADILTSAPRESQYDTKKQGNKPIASKDMGISVNGEIPEGKIPVVIDNVVDSGNTAEACIRALGTGIVASLADSTERGHAASLKSAAPVVYDKNGNIIPLSQRFEFGKPMFYKPDTAEDIMDEVEGRKELSAAIESSELQKPSAEEFEVRQRATDAVMTAINKTGVKINEVSQREADDMMQLYAVVNERPIIENALRERTNKRQRYAVINVRDPYGVPAFFEKRQYAKEYQSWGNRFGGMFKTFDLEPLREDHTEEELREAAEIMPMSGWHGSGAVFTKFDHSHMGEGAGSQTFGYGTYLSDNRGIGEDYARMTGSGWTYLGKERRDYAAGKNLKDETIRDILSNLDLDYHYKEAVGKVRHYLQTAIKDYEDNMADLSKDDMEDYKEHKAVLEFVNSLKYSDFKEGRKNLYKVEIPDDNGENYLDYMKTIKKPLRRKIANAVRSLDGEPEQSWISPQYKNGWDSLADMIERNQWAYKEIRNRLVQAFGGRLEDEKKVSDLMSSIGFVGVKYPAGTIFGNGRGATNYVIFNENNAKIQEHIQFMFEEPDNKPVFYSNAMKAVKGISQGKATPEQWLKMIEKSGGLKAGEDKWIGLSDWLKEQQTAGKKTVTKQEIEDYIRQHQIEINDTKYSKFIDIDNNPTMQELRREFDELVKKHEDSRKAINEEANTVNQEMLEKYGKGWAVDPGKLDKEDRDRLADMSMRYKKLHDNDPRKLAFEEMANKHGDDFSNAFEVNYGNGKLVPQRDGYYDELSEEAKRFLQFDEQPINSTRLAYTTEGLENKREIALTVPTIEPYNEGDNIHFGDAGGGRAIAWIRFGDAMVAEESKEHEASKAAFDDYVQKLNKKYGYNVLDVFAHPDAELTPDEKAEMDRLEDEYIKTFHDSTKKVLVIDEIQSKRHQDAREKGYKRGIRSQYEEVVEPTRKRHSELVAKRDELIERINKIRDNILHSPEAQAMIGEDGYLKDGMTNQYHALYENNQELTDLENERGKVVRKLRDLETEMRNINAKYLGGIPDAPFEKNWHELAMKRMLRYAAENGYDKIAWTTGDQQAERYNLGGKVKRIFTFEPDDYANEHGEYRNVQIDFPGNQEPIFINIDKDGNIMSSDMSELRGKHLSDALGKDLANKILTDEPGKYYEGEDLRIGGEGMNGFYDQILPRFMDKYGKKWGVKVYDRDYNLSDDGHVDENGHMVYSRDYTFHTIDITPEMRESVMQGQPMFQKSKGGKMYGWTDGKQIFLTPAGMNPNTPAHEYTHLWAKYVEENDPELWKDIVKVMKQTDMWKQVRENPNYRSIWEDDNRMASEVLSRLSGATTEEEFVKAATGNNKDSEGILDAVKSALKKFWEYIKNLFSSKNRELFKADWQTVARMPLKDLLRGFNPVEGETEKGQPMFHVGEPTGPAEELSDHAKEIFKAAKERFGATRDIREADYVLPDGTMLDFSGRHLVNPGTDTSFLNGRRTTDHRDIADINYERDGNTKSGIETSMPDFIKSGAIRIDDNAGSINLAVKPTDKQLNVLRQLIARNEGYVTVDFGDGWDSDHYAEYEDVKPQRVLADIVRYFDDNIKPISRIASEPGVQSQMEGNLFTDADFLPEQKTATGKKKPTDMSDEELLAAIGEKDGKERRKLADLYDSRHMDDLQNQEDNYIEMLEFNNTTMEQAMEMYDNVFKDFKNGGYASADRTKYLAQIDALEKYIDDLQLREEERQMAEQEELEQQTKGETEAKVESKAETKVPTPEQAEQTQKQEEAKKQFEQQQNEIHKSGYDLTQMRLRPLREGETCHVERRYVENGYFSFTGKDKIESIDDIAYIFRQLEDAAVENVFCVLVKDGTPTIIHLGMGSYTESSADISPALAAYYELKPDKVYFVHNHPSGNLKCSKNDQNVWTHMKRIFGNKMEDGIIIDTKSGKYGLFNDNMSLPGMRMPESPENSVPMKVYSFSKQVFDEDWNPETAFDAGTALRVAKFVSSHRLGDHKKMSLIVMGQNYKVTGNVFLPYTELSQVANEAAADLIAKYMNQMGGTIVSLYGNYEYGYDAKDQVNKLQKLLDRRNVFLVDVVHVDNPDHYKSIREMGYIREPEPTVYNASEPVTDPNEIQRLDNEPTEIGYRNVVMNEDGTLGSPMANRLGRKGVGRKPTSMFNFEEWERSDENPDLATEDGKIDLIKPDSKEVGNVDYNPYIHIRPTLVNKQFKQAWERPNLVYVRTEYPASELTSGYHAEKAKLSVGRHPWNGGELILSRWDKPIEIVPWEEVADDWVKEFEGTEGIHFDIIPPKLLPILAERGMTILPPHKGMGKACNDAYEAFKKSHEKAKVVDMQLKQIEDMYTEGLLPAEAADMKYRVNQMSPRELVMQYKRLNDQMLDEDGLNIDEQEDKVRQAYLDEHGVDKGFGKAMADHMVEQAKKYTWNKMSLRWDILDRIKELGLEAYIDKDLKQYVDINDLEGAKSADIVKMYRQTTPAENRANVKFNAQLDEYAKGKMSSGKMFELGEPSPILKTCGVNGKQIKMKQSVLADHMDKHDLRFDDLKNLPTALYHPIMVYQWGDKAQSNVIVTELTTKDGRKVTVTIRVNKTGDVLDVEKITSVHGKDLERIIKEINTEKSEFAKDNLKYLNKKKALDWLTMDPPKGSRIDNRELNSAANILKSFENPILSDENLRNIYGNYIVAGDETADMLGGVKVIYELEAPESGTLGWYDPNDNSVHVVLPEHVDAGEVKRTVCHEKLGHEGLVALMGSQEEVDKFGQFIFKSAAKDVRQRILDKANENDPGWKDPKRFSHAAQEVFADIAADGPRTAEEFSLWTKVKHYLINLLNKLGLRIRGLLNDHDLRYYVLKTGEALKRWNQMTPQEQKVTAREETDYDLMRSRRGRPRKRNNESMAQYLQRLRDWERWKIAEEEAAANNDPMPEAEKINEKWHEKFNNDLAEWKRQNNIEDDTETLGEFPKRERGESPQEYASRVADYETKVDAWKEAPSLFDYLQQANDEYRREYAAWKERYGIREQESVDMGLYEGDPDRLPHIVDPEDLEADMRAEAELTEAVGIDMSPEGAKRHTKLSIVERRKNLESANAEDAIWIHNLVKKLNIEAKLQGVKPEELRAAMADIIEGTYFEDVIKDEAGNIISIEDISDKLPIKRTPGLEAIMSEIKDWYDYFFHAIEDAGLRNDAGYVEQGYVNHVWDKSRSNPEAWSKYVENFQRTKSPNMRERLFNTYREGRDVGLVPKFDDIADILAYYSSSNNQAIANKKLLDDLSFIVVEQKNSDGEVVTVLPLMNSRKPNIAVADFYKMYPVPGVGDVYVLKDVQRQFANVFGTMRTGDIPEWLSQVGKGYDVVSSTAKKIELAFSAFHMGALTEVAMAQMRPDRALRALGQYIIFDCAKTGTIPAYAHPEDFKLAAGHLVQLGATQDYSAADVNNVTEKLREIVRQLAKEENLAKKGAGIAATPIAAALDYINKGMDKVLWNYLHDGLKIACFKMFAEQIDKRVEKKGLTAEQREQLLDEAGQYVNDTFGGQYWELLNVSPALIKWMRRAFLSPDWLISTQRHFLANFGFGSVYSESGFLNYLRYNADNIKRAFGFDVPRDENRRFRSKNAKQCYLLGVCGFFYILMNAINAMFRAKDESKEKEKADEIRQTNPDYKSPYELAYPDGMKWYDYTMYGNTIGQQTHLFLGRYDDGTEWYARWGKQFREFPELFMGRHGVEFPTPLMERMSGKANPIGRYLMYDLPLTVGMYGYKQPRETQEIAEKYGNTVALLAMTAKKFIPYSVPTQQDKEFKMFDLVMPSQKGFTRWKAVDYFKTYVQAGDMDGVMRTYNAAVMNGIDAEDCMKAAIATVKATQRKELSDGIVDLQSAMERYDAEKDVAEKKRLRRKIFGYLAEQNYKVFTKDEAREQVEFFLSGEQPKQADNDINKYVQLATSADVRDEYRLEMIRQQSKKYADEVKTAEGDRQKKLEESYGNWLDIYDIVKDANREIGRLKRQLGKGDDDSAIMDEIRTIRKQAQQEVDKIQAP